MPARNIAFKIKDPHPSSKIEFASTASGSHLKSIERIWDLQHVGIDHVGSGNIIAADIKISPTVELHNALGSWIEPFDEQLFLNMFNAGYRHVLIRALLLSYLLRLNVASPV